MEARFEAPEGLRLRTARGTLVNGAFLLGLNTLGLLKSVLVATFLTRGEYGIWGIVFITLTSMIALKQVGVSDKYIQQDEADQRVAYEKAFTLELIYAACFTTVMVMLLPLLAVAYGRWDIVLPGLAVALVIPGLALQAPLWVFYRRLQFGTQRALQAIDPLVGFAVTMALAAAGLGYWSLVVGLVAGAWCAAAAALVACPYRPAIRYERGTALAYFDFSWPLLIAAAAAALIAQMSVFAGEAVAGVGAAGAIVFAATFATYASRLDGVVTQTIYPVICAVQDRADLLLESFLKSNRLAIMAGGPFGAGLALFAPDLVEFVVGGEWRPAVVLIQVFGLTAAISQIGFNWSAFYRARGETRPIAIEALASLTVFCVAALPLLAIEGLDGFAAGIGIMTLASLVVRGAFVKRLFPGLHPVGHAARALAPTLAGAGAVLGARLLWDTDRELGRALGELASYLAVVVGVTLALERALLREILGYLSRPRPAPPPEADATL